MREIFVGEFWTGEADSTVSIGGYVRLCIFVEAAPSIAFICFQFRPNASAVVTKLFAAQIHSTAPRYDLMEFFDDPENWGKNEVPHGRAWRADDLRIKSNSDLHKLWFVLLKERNMLLTMEHEYEAEHELFPSPERLDKVNAHTYEFRKK